MSFKPSENQEFHIIAKNSGKALSIVPDSSDIQLKQVTYKPNDARQQFKFTKEFDLFWIMTAPYKQRFLTVHEHSKQDNAPIIMWNWEPKQDAQRFYIEPAYDGYYRIKSKHSKLFLSVHGNSKDDGAGVVQQQLNETGSQLFYFVPVINNAISTNPTSFNQYNDLMRTGILKLISFVPEAGEPLAFITGLFWTAHNQLADLWEQMKAYVDVRIRELILENKLKELREMLEGELKVLAEIQEAPGKKGDRLRNVMDNIVQKEPHFTKQPKEVLSYLVAFGTIAITLRRMMVVNYKELFGEEPSAETLANNKKNLKKAIKEYTDAVNESKADLLKWRIGLIRERNSEKEEKNNIMLHIAWDSFDNWAMRWPEELSKPEQKDYSNRCDNDVKLRRICIASQYKWEMEECFYPAMFWQYMDVDAKPYHRGDHLVTVGPFGGLYTSNFFKGVNTGLTRIDLFTYKGVLCGLEVFYTGVSYGLKGGKGDASVSLQMSKDEYITSVNLNVRDFVKGIWFTTQKGRTIGAGTAGDTYFNADLPCKFNPRLAVITGCHQGMAIEQISFEWLVTV